MKTLKQAFTFTLILASLTVFAKNITTKFKVEGQCGECKENIEQALDIPGISYAEWNVESKMLTVRYNDKKIALDDIHEIISNVGYATSERKANLDAQKKLSACCQPKTKSCCADKSSCKPKK